VAARSGHPKVPVEAQFWDREVLFLYENCVLLASVRPVCRLLLGSLMFKIDIRVHKQSVFRQIPKRGGQDLRCSCCAVWVGGLCGLYICYYELGRELLEPLRKDHRTIKVRSSSPTVTPTPPRLLNHVLKCHLQGW